MKKLGLLFASWLICTNGQIIFPDQLAVLRHSTDNDYSPRPFPTLPSGLSFDNRPFPSFAAPSFEQSDGSSILSEPSYSSAFSGTGYDQSPASDPQLPLLGSSPNAGPVDNEAQYWSNHSVMTARHNKPVNNLIARGVTKFTLDMDRAIHRAEKPESPSEKKNVIFSPLSLVGTLAMVLLGSAGTTFDEVARILGLEADVDISQHSEIVHSMFGLLLDSILPKPNITGPRTTIASGIFVQNGYPIRSEFETISQRIYKNEVINLDFMGHPNVAKRAINDWVKTRTNGKIKSILTESLDPETKLILASALYFSGEWNRHFFHRGTKRKPFMVTPTQTVTVDMMYTGGDFPFYEDKQLGVKIIGLPYKGYDPASSTQTNVKYQASMYVMLPTSTNEDALLNLENRLTPEIIDGMMSKMINRTCIVGLPRMSLSSNLNLNQALRSLGLVSLFDPRTSNLGLLTPGYSDSTRDPRPTIFTRINDDDDNENRNNSSNSETKNRQVDRRTKNHYFRYEDKKGGYKVEQWNNGVIIEKIRRSSRRRRSSMWRSADNENDREGKSRRGPSTNQRKKENYRLSENSTDRVKFVEIGNEKYKFSSKSERTKRQSRPIDDAFLRFIQNRETQLDFGLDKLRNSPNIVNPGLFASDVLQTVKLDVMETGTVAAAATAILVQRGGDIQRFVAERPFLFFIKHEPSKLILFWGTVNKPTPNY